MDISGLKMENTECNIILDNLSREKVKLTFRLIQILQSILRTNQLD